MAANAQTDERLDCILAEYFQSLDRGDAVSPQILIETNSDLADQLREFFDAASFVEGLAGPTQSEQTQMLSANDTARSVLLGETIVSGVQPAPARRGLQGGNFPQHFGRYEIVRLLGQGAMGAVYLAYDPSLQRQVALKIPKFNAEESPDMSERFLREARSAATLRHANICPVYDAGRVDGVHYITMAYIEGRTLAEELRAGCTFQPREIAQTVRKLALALGKAHGAGVVHRDLKPGNIMLDPDGEPILMDFGLAYREETDELRLTKSGMIVGSPAYMSPEQIDGDPAKIGPASDIYSLGVVLYEMITGKLPFQGTMMSVIGQIASKEPTPVGQWRPELADSPLARLCQKMLAKRPEQRPQSMQDVAAALDYVLSGLTHPRKERATERRSDGGIGQSDVVEASFHPSVAPSLRPESAPIPPFQPALPAPVKFPEAVLAQERRDRARMFLATTLILAALLGLFGALAGIVYVATDQGTLEITSHLDNVRIEVTSDDGVRVLDVDSGTTVHRLRSGDYRIAVAGDQTRVALDKTGFKITRGGKVVVEALLRGGTTTISGEAMATPQEVAGPAPIGESGLKQLVRLEGHESYSLSLDFSPDGWRLVTACGQPDCRVRLWDARNGRLLREFPAGTKSLHTVTSSPDGNFVAAAGKSGEIILLDAKELKEVRRWKAHEGYIDCLAFSPDSRRLASGSDNWSSPEADVSVRVWEVETGSLAWKQDLPQIVRGRPEGGRGGQVFGVAYSPDGKHLLTAHQGPDEPLTMWQADSGQLVRKFGKSATPVRCAAWSPDGRVLATGHAAVNTVGNRWADAEHCVIRLYDAETGNELRTLQGHTGPLESLDFSPDNKLLVSGSGGQYLNDDFYERESSDNSIRIWEVASGRQLHRHDLAAAVKCVRFSPDGTKIASSAGAVGAKADVQIWAVPSGLEPSPSPLYPGPQPVFRLTDYASSVRAIAFEADGQHFATAGFDNTIRRRRLADGSEVKRIAVDRHAPYRAAFAADGRLVTSGLDATIRVFDLAAGHEVLQSTAHAKPVAALAIEPAGKTSLTGSWDGTLLRWDLSATDPKPVADSAGTVWDIDITADGKQAAVADFRGPVTLWNLETKQPPVVLGKHQGGALAVRFVEGGKRLLSAGRDGKLVLWNLADGLAANEYSFEGSLWIESLGVSPGGQRVLVGLSASDKPEEIRPEAGQCVVFNLNTFQVESRLHTGTPCVYATVFSPDGKSIVAAGGQHDFAGGGAVSVWRLEDVLREAQAGPRMNAQETHRFEGHTQYVMTVAFARGGKLLASAGADQKILLWDVATGKSTFTPDHGNHSDDVRAIAFTEGFNRFLTVGNDRALKVWDTDALRCTATYVGMIGHTNNVSSLVVLPGGRRAVTGSDDTTLMLWDLEQNKRIDTARFHVGPVSCLALAPDGKTIASGGGGNQVILCEIQDDPQVREDEKLVLKHRLVGHVAEIRGLCFTPDGKYVISGGRDGTVRLWDPAEGKFVKSLLPNIGVVYAVKVSPDGKLLAVGGGDWNKGAIKIYNFATGQLLTEITKFGGFVHALDFADNQTLAAGSGDKSVTIWRLEESATPAAAAEGSPEPVAGEPIDLLGNLDPERHITAAPWAHAVTEGFTFRKGKSKYSSLVPSVSVGGEYDLRVEVTRTKGDQPAITFPVARAACTLVLGRVQDQVGGLEIIDQRTVSTPGNPATFRSPLLDDVRHTITIQVRLPGDQAQVTCQYDGKPLTQWRGDPATLSVSRHWQLPREGRIGLGAWCERGTVTYHKAELQPLGRRPVEQIDTSERLFTSERAHGFSVAVSADGAQALVGHYGRGVSLWDVASGKRIKQFEGTEKAVHRVLFWPDGQHVAAASEDGSIRLWNRDTAEEVRQFKGHAGRVDCLALSRDGALLLSASADYGDDRDHSVRLWNAHSGEELRQFGEVAKYFRDIEFSHDAARAYGAGVGFTSIVEWDVASGAPVHRFQECPTAPISLAVSPDGSLLATGHFAIQRKDGQWNDPENAVVRLWNLEDHSIERELRGHAGPVGDVAFTPDGRFLLSAATGEHTMDSQFIPSSDQTVRLWDVASGRELARYHAQERVIQLAVLSDGKTFLTVGDSIRLWKLPERAWPEAPLSPAAPPAAAAPFDAAQAQRHQQAWADHLGVPVEYTSPLGMRFRLIPPGEFDMGSTAIEAARLAPQDGWFFAKWAVERRQKEMPQRRVRITRPFYLGEHEVTVADFRKFLEASGYATCAERDPTGGAGYVGGEWKQDKEHRWNSPGFAQGDDHPVVNLAWEDAAAYCEWLGKQGPGGCRLPTEAEWEYACRAGTTTLFSSGDEPASLEGAANLADQSLAKAAAQVTWQAAWDDQFAYSAPVGKFQPNAFGLFDMHGNASEWCHSWYGDYLAGVTEDPSGPPSGSRRAFRGGSFDNWVGFARSADRYSSHSPTIRTDWAGLRVVLPFESALRDKSPSKSKE